MNDEHLYLQATEEVESETRNSALWAKAMALSDGNLEKAKYHYIKLRVEQLETEDQESADTIELQSERFQIMSPKLGETQATKMEESEPVAEIKTQPEESSMRWLHIIASWTLLIIVVLLYANQAHPYITGIDFISTALGALLGVWIIVAILFGLIAAAYRAASGKKMRGFTVVVPLIAAVMVFIVLLVLY